MRAHNLAVSIDGRWIVEDLNFAIAAGEMVAVVGPNGAGKSTFIRALAGLIPAFGDLELGGVLLSDLDRRTRARVIAYLPQGHVFHWPLSVAEVVALGRLPHSTAGTVLSDADRAAVMAALQETEIEGLADRPVTELSAGERARVALARVLAVEAPVILADEPTTALDAKYQLLMLELLRRQSDAGVAVISVLHDLALAARFADRILVMQHGKIAADGPPAILSERLLRGVFGVEAALVEHQGERLMVPWSVSSNARSARDRRR